MAHPNLFSVGTFAFPYVYKFPGQSTDEKLLYVTRESDVSLIFREITVLISATIIFGVGILSGQLLRSLIGASLVATLQLFLAAFSIIFLLLGLWWVRFLWKNSIAIVTTTRLTKFVYTTPWNRHNLSLPLDMIVDTGAYSKGWMQALFRLGTLTARSSASSSGVSTDDPERVNKKYFYIENIAYFEDLHHYLHKVLLAHRQHPDQLASFRPFLPQLKGEARERFMQQFPQYWS